MCHMAASSSMSYDVHHMRTGLGEGWGLQMGVTTGKGRRHQERLELGASGQLVCLRLTPLCSSDLRPRNEPWEFPTELRISQDTSQRSLVAVTMCSLVTLRMPAFPEFPSIWSQEGDVGPVRELSGKRGLLLSLATCSDPWPPCGGERKPLS